MDNGKKRLKRKRSLCSWSKRATNWAFEEIRTHFTSRRFCRFGICDRPAVFVKRQSLRNKATKRSIKTAKTMEKRKVQTRILPPRGSPLIFALLPQNLWTGSLANLCTAPTNFSCALLRAWSRAKLCLHANNTVRFRSFVSRATQSEQNTVSYTSTQGWR